MKSVFAFLFFRFGATNGVFFRLSGGDYQFVHPKGQQNICLMYAFKKKQDLGMVFAYLNIKKTESKWKSHLIFCPLITMFTYVVM